MRAFDSLIKLILCQTYWFYCIKLLGQINMPH